MNDMTIAQLAKKMRYSPAYISHIINGRMIPSKKCAEDWENATNGEILACDLLSMPLKKGVEAKMQNA